jgi:hypothetical protein
MILAALLAALSATLPPAPRCASGHPRVNYPCRWPMGRLAGGWARCGWVVAHAKGRHCEQHEREFWRRARACPLPVWTLQRRRGGCCGERVRYRTPSACARTHKRSAHCPPARGRDKAAGDGPDRTERTAASFPRQERGGGAPPCSHACSPGWRRRPRSSSLLHAPHAPPFLPFHSARSTPCPPGRPRRGVVALVEGAGNGRRRRGGRGSPSLLFAPFATHTHGDARRVTATLPATPTPCQTWGWNC